MLFGKSIKKSSQIKCNIRFFCKNPISSLLLTGVVMELEIFKDFLLKLRKEKRGSDTFVVEKNNRKEASI